MATTITINGTDYQLPTQGTNPPWGSDLSSIIEAIADVVNNLSAAGDILTTSFSVPNNQSSAAVVTGLSFDTATIRSAVVTYSVYRSTTTEELAEEGLLLLTYKNTANEWVMSRTSNADAGLVFDVTSAGQVTYTSSNMSGASYTGLLKFKAETFSQS